MSCQQSLPNGTSPCLTWPFHTVSNVTCLCFTWLVLYLGKADRKPVRTRTAYWRGSVRECCITMNGFVSPAKDELIIKTVNTAAWKRELRRRRGLKRPHINVFHYNYHVPVCDLFTSEIRESTRACCRVNMCNRRMSHTTLKRTSSYHVRVAIRIQKRKTEK